MIDLQVSPISGHIIGKLKGSLEPGEDVTNQVIHAVLDHLTIQAQECDGYFSKHWHDKDHLIELTIRPNNGVSRKDNCNAYTNQYSQVHKSKVFALHNLDENMMYIVKLDPDDHTHLKLQSNYCDALNGTHRAVLTPIPIEKFNAGVDAAIAKLKSIKHEIIQQEVS